MPKITKSDLKPGDIIFFITQEDGREDYYDHVAMYSHQKDGTDYIIHSSFEQKELCVTCLEKIPNNNYHVFRCKNESASQSALNRLKKWLKFHIPYDNKRLTHLLELEEDASYCTPQKYLEYSQERFKKFGIWRAIKFAVRRDVRPAQAPVDGYARGLICTSAIVLAFQIEELVPSVKTLKEMNIEWVSDKYGTQESLDTKNPIHSSYLSYKSKLATPNQNPQHDTYLPSISAWKSDKDPQNFEFTTGLNIDSKDLSVGALALLLQKLPEQWQDLGALELLSPAAFQISPSLSSSN